MRVMICRKEIKESAYWLRLIDLNKDLESQREILLNETSELMKIFGAILKKK